MNMGCWLDKRLYISIESIPFLNVRTYNFFLFKKLVY